MAALSIRKLPPELDRAIQNEVKKRRSTRTDVVLGALREVFGPVTSSRQPRRDVRGFFGKMTKPEYEKFKKSTKDFSSIDEDMWK